MQIINLVCVPIRNPEKQVIGVVQVINKLNGKCFTEGDISILEVKITFLFVCSVVVQYSMWNEIPQDLVNNILCVLNIILSPMHE